MDQQYDHGETGKYPLPVEVPDKTYGGSIIPYRSKSEIHDQARNGKQCHDDHCNDPGYGI